MNASCGNACWHCQLQVEYQECNIDARTLNIALPKDNDMQGRIGFCVSTLFRKRKVYIILVQFIVPSALDSGAKAAVRVALHNSERSNVGSTETISERSYLWRIVKTLGLEAPAAVLRNYVRIRYIHISCA